MKIVLLLTAIETGEVEQAMVAFGDIIQNLQDNDFTNFKEQQSELKSASYAVAQAIKKSANSWELPASMKK